MFLIASVATLLYFALFVMNISVISITPPSPQAECGIYIEAVLAQFSDRETPGTPEGWADISHLLDSVAAPGLLTQKLCCLLDRFFSRQPVSDTKEIILSRNAVVK